MSSIETIEVFGPHGRMIINLHELDAWRAKGFKTADEIKEKEGADEKSLEDMTVSELKRYADNRQIDISGLTKKSDILEAIQLAEAEQE